MRLIDADALRKPIYAEDDNITGIGMTYDEMDAYNSGIKETWKIVENAPTIAAYPWHRVEEPPKEEGRYWFAVWFAGHWIFDAAWYTHDISTVIDVPCCERVGGFYKGNTEVHPDYWMPIPEPPKEDA